MFNQKLFGQGRIITAQSFGGVRSVSITEVFKHNQSVLSAAAIKYGTEWRVVWDVTEKFGSRPIIENPVSGIRRLGAIRVISDRVFIHFFDYECFWEIGRAVNQAATNDNASAGRKHILSSEPDLSKSLVQRLTCHLCYEVRVMSFHGVMKH